MIEKIGRIVLNTQYYTGDDQYTDGDIEDVILEIVKSPADLFDILSKEDRWPVIYHLSNQRKNILQVMDIKKTDTVLEIGAGCGALTGGIARRAKHITCVELSKKRSLINSYRNKEFDNIDIMVGDFNAMQFEEGYDVITLIGVLEYAKLYAKNDTIDPYSDFLFKVKGLLNKGGKLYIAIENKLGLKYFSGAPEDHTGIVFDGITGYKSVTNVMTFTKKELENMLFASGFANLRFFYPFPDYKFCKVIFSDENMPRVGDIRDLDVNYDRERTVYFNETNAIDSIVQGGYVDIFSNSFLIEAVREH